MSTTTLTAPRTRVSFGGVLRSEAIRFFSLTSTKVLIIVAIVVSVGFSALGVWGVGQMATQFAGMPEMGMPDAAAPGFMEEMTGSGVVFTQLILGALGVLLASGEFTTGSAVSTFLASPQRTRVLAAKAVLITLATVVAQVAATLLSFAAAKPIASSFDLPLELASSEFMTVLGYGALGAVVAALIGLCLGILLRSSAGGITVLVALFFVLPLALQVLVAFVDWVKQAVAYMPDQLTLSLAMPMSYPSELETWQQLLGVAGWIIVPLVLAGWALKSRDI